MCTIYQKLRTPWLYHPHEVRYGEQQPHDLWLWSWTDAGRCGCSLSPFIMIQLLAKMKLHMWGRRWDHRRHCQRNHCPCCFNEVSLNVRTCLCRLARHFICWNALKPCWACPTLFTGFVQVLESLEFFPSPWKPLISLGNKEETRLRGWFSWLMPPPPSLKKKKKRHAFYNLKPGWGCSSAALHIGSCGTKSLHRPRQKLA